MGRCTFVRFVSVLILRLEKDFVWGTLHLDCKG